MRFRGRTEIDPDQSPSSKAPYAVQLMIGHREEWTSMLVSTIGVIGAGVMGSIFLQLF